ncbi:UNVERIFIED_CONTAM: Retrovirus-related Pol polyprotein from transposon TNT 1-94 [Sesamum radiatum]|uniref:Retrovirus-related Pol polyprotein from transposon TNT 1-94 n=1 Tax=Sesamum radiatum TaxID=300843 RepID=A0AAW2KQ48_SESRA
MSAWFTMLSCMHDNLIREYEKYPMAKELWEVLKVAYGSTSATRLRALTFRFNQYLDDPTSSCDEGYDWRTLKCRFVASHLKLEADHRESEHTQQAAFVAHAGQSKPHKGKHWNKPTGAGSSNSQSQKQNLAPQGNKAMKRCLGKRGGKKNMAKADYYNCQKIGHFARECTEPKKHVRLGHIGQERMTRLAREGLLGSLAKVNLPTCEPCMAGKARRKPFWKANRATQHLEFPRVNHMSYEILRAAHLSLSRIEGESFMCASADIDEPATSKEAVTSPNANEWMTAMKEEMSSMAKNNIWKLVDLPTGRKTIGNKWVLKVKRKADGSIKKFKARLVAKGYTQKEDLELFQIDLKTSFLNGELDEEIYINQHEGFQEIGQKRKVCSLKCSIYGLKQSSMHWYHRFHRAITSIGFTMVEEDHYTSRTFELCPKTDEEKKCMANIAYASAVGSLIYAMMCTRPDLCFAVGMVSRYRRNPGPEHWVAVKRILRYLKGTSDLALCYHGGSLRLVGYSDADGSADRDERKSTSGYAFL